MLIEVKVRVTRLINGKQKKATETYLLEKEIFAEAEYAVVNELEEEKRSHVVDDYEIQSLRISPIKEMTTPDDNAFTFIATLKDIFLEDNGTEKNIRYKLLLWASNIADAQKQVSEMVKQGYDMVIEGIKQVDYIWLYNEESNQNAGDDDK